MQFLLHHTIKRKTQYLLGVSLVVAVSGLCYLLSAYVSPEAVAFALLLTLSVIAMFFDLLPLLVCGLLSVLIWDFLFLPPHFALYVNKNQDIVTLCMYFIVVLLNAVLTYKIRQIEKKAREKEEKAQALELYNTLLDSLSHELRTPISVIIGATDNLLAGSPSLSGNDKKDLLNSVSLAALRLNHQVENLLNMSRLRSGFLQLKKDWCDLHELVGNLLQQLEPELQQHQVQVSIPENFPLFMADYGLLQQALYNLVYNARQYTPPGSTVFITAAYTDTALTIKVEDNGPGFPVTAINKAFERFYRSKNAGPQGTGLGLSIAKGFTEAHNGTIALQNGAAGGASFEITIPAGKILLTETAG